MVTSNRLKRDAREHQKLHGTSYQQALAAVTATSQAPVPGASDPVRVCRERWAAAERAETVRAELGTTASGDPFTLDFGPTNPALIAVVGAARAGRTNVLAAAATSMAHGYGSSRVRFIRVAATAPVPVAKELLYQELGEQVLRVDELGDMLRLRAEVRALLEARQRQLDGHDVPSVHDVRERLPEIIVIVDDYALSGGPAREELDELLAGISRLGRSLGVRALVGAEAAAIEGWRGPHRVVALTALDGRQFRGAWMGDEEISFIPHHAYGAVLRAMRADVALAAAAPPATRRKR